METKGRAESIVTARRGAASGGFTIIELMVVVVIITVLATIAAPSFHGVGETDMLVRAAGEVQQAFDMARSHALLKSAAVRIIVRRGASGTLPNIRVDESPNSSCDGWDDIATDPLAPDPSESSTVADCGSWTDAERSRCGIRTVYLTGSYAAPAYKDADIGFTSIQTGSEGHWDTELTTEFVLCVNRRGRLLKLTGTDWLPVVGGLRLQLDRNSTSTPLGLTKTIYVPQGSVAGVER